LCYETNGRGEIEIISFFLFKEEGKFDIHFLKVVRVSDSLRMDAGRENRERS
jgi:hypothetical protein